jgi:hypothetical protein
MTSSRQIEANRRNASKSTGPTTEQGTQRSRCNAVRHGLTAETVIGALEDAQDYRAFEAAITADYDAQSSVERELVLRLASLLWRLRRATSMESGLFEIQVEHLTEIGKARHISTASRQFGYSLFEQPSVEPKNDSSVSSATGEPQTAQPHDARSTELMANHAGELARCFLRLANLPNFALDRLNRYEIGLWRQVGQTLFALGGAIYFQEEDSTRRGRHKRWAVIPRFVVSFRHLFLGRFLV